jgi:hypothetical protein
MNLRKATNNDSEALIDSIYSEYGEVMHTAGADSDLLEIAPAILPTNSVHWYQILASGKLRSVSMFWINRVPSWKQATRASPDRDTHSGPVGMLGSGDWF